MTDLTPERATDLAERTLGVIDAMDPDRLGTRSYTNADRE